MARREIAAIVVGLLGSLGGAPHPAHSQTIDGRPFDAVALAAGGAVPLSQGDARALAWNPAALASADTAWSLAASLARPFGLTDLATAGFALAHTQPPWGVAASVETFGNEAYRETSLAGGIGVRLAQHVRAGASFRATGVQINGYEPSSLLTASSGIIAGLSHNLLVSFVGRSLVARRRGEVLLSANRSLSASGEYRATPQVRLTALLSRARGRRWSGAVALVLDPRPWMRLYLGRTSGPHGFTGGCEIAAGHARFAYGVRFHPDLDPTQAVSVTVVR